MVLQKSNSSSCQRVSTCKLRAEKQLEEEAQTELEEIKETAILSPTEQLLTKLGIY